MDFHKNSILEVTENNHDTALNFLTHVDAYISKQLSFGAMLGPLEKHPFSMHISPFRTRDKSGSHMRWVIMDLGWPKGSSVNDGVQNNTYLGKVSTAVPFA